VSETAIPPYVYLIVLGLGGMLLAAALSPIETLGWWAGWFAREGDTPAAEKKKADRSRGELYVVYLAGIASISGDLIVDEEKALLDRIRTGVPGTVIVDDVFPYSVNNLGLLGNRPFRWAFRVSYSLRLRGLLVLSLLINTRNIFQVAISADKRYGPIYNFGSAHAVVDGLLRQGYALGSGTPIVMLGYSGGGQISLGLIAFLKEITGAPIYMISLGGVMCSDPGMDGLEHFYHLDGEKDWVPMMGTILYGGRWPFRKGSHWNRARDAGKLTYIPVEKVAHFGRKGYLDRATHLLDGRSYFDLTAAIIVDLVSDLRNGKWREAAERYRPHHWEARA
jgi:hypothetical protein